MKPNRFERDYKDTAAPSSGMVRETSNKTKLDKAHGKICLSCDLCGILFETYACWAKRASRHYCSRACASEGKITQAENTCVICGDTFMTKKSDSEANRKTTCSTECRKEKRRRFLNCDGRAKALNGMRFRGKSPELIGEATPSPEQYPVSVPQQ